MKASGRASRAPIRTLFAVAAAWLWLLAGAALAQEQAPVAPPPAAAEPAQAEPASPARAQLEAARREIQQVEAAVELRQSDEAALQRLRTRLDAVAAELREIDAEYAPRAEQARARLEQLGPRPEAGAPPESAEIVAEREARTRTLAEAEELPRLARAALVQAEQMINSINDRRRVLFTSTLFQRGESLLSGDLWGMLLASLPQDLRALRLLGSDWLGRVLGAAPLRSLALLLLALGAAVGLYRVRALLLPRIMARLGTSAESGGLKRILTAWVRLIAGSVPAAAASLVVYAALVGGRLLPPRVEPFVGTLLGGLAFYAFILALSSAALAPSRPERRLFGVSDRNARAIKNLLGAITVVVVLSKASEALLQSIAAGLSLSIVGRSGFALIFAAVLAHGLNAMRDSAVEQHPEFGPYVPKDAAVLGPLRVLCWLLVVVITASVLAGYVFFASFLIDQFLWIVIVTLLCGMLLALADEGLRAMLAGSGRVSLVLQTNVGLRKRSLEQIAVVASGIVKLVLLVAAVLLILAPWGVESDDLATAIRAAFFGFKVGDVTISLSAVLVAGLLFAAGLAATKALQRWLDDKFLPATDIDPGLRNTLRTMAGYVGMLAAAALAVTSLGLNLERLTIVAGALSVGIGFGLQSIVQNFVSGLILLWERTIKVGDLVVVGPDSGVVRRINVRATEIETGERTIVLVPNATLITGVVQNKVRADRLARVLIAVRASYDADPAEVMALLRNCAEAHPDVLRDPAIWVGFKSFGENALHFELICFVAEVNISGRVSSELHLSIFRAMKAAGLGFPYPHREVIVRQGSLAEAAEPEAPPQPPGTPSA